MKYLEAAKVTFKAQFAYRFDIALNMIYTIAKILLAYILWGAIFAGQDQVSGFTFDAMLTYYVISSFLSQMDMSSGSGDEIASRILNGTFSCRMVQPISIFGFYAAQTAGAAAFHLGFNLIAAGVWVAVLRIPLAIAARIPAIAGAVLLILLGLLFMQQMNYLIGIMAFKFHEVWIFQMIKDNIVQFATGGLIPLMLLPERILAFMRALPFYYVTYLPSMLLMGRNETELLPGLLILGAWCAALGAINRIVYRRFRTLYDGVGI